MIPRVFDRTETEYASEGLGRTADCSRCLVAIDVEGLRYEASLEIPGEGAGAELLEVGRQFTALPYPGGLEQPFDIVELEGPGLDGMLTAQGQHVSYRLSKIPCVPFTAADAREAMESLGALGGSLTPFTFTWWGSYPPRGEYVHQGGKSIRAVLSEIAELYGCVLWFERFGVFLFPKTEPVSTAYSTTGTVLLDDYNDGFADENGRPVLFFAGAEALPPAEQLPGDLGRDRGVTVAWGKNLTSLSRRVSGRDSYDQVCAVWTGKNEGGGSESLCGWSSCSDESLPVSARRVLELDVSGEFSSETVSVAALADRAQKYYLENPKIAEAQVSLEAEYVDLYATSEDDLGRELIAPWDVATVLAPGLPEPVKARVGSGEFEAVGESYERIGVGKKPPGLSEYIAETQDDVKAARDAAEDPGFVFDGGGIPRDPEKETFVQPCRWTGVYPLSYGTGQAMEQALTSGKLTLRGTLLSYESNGNYGFEVSASGGSKTIGASGTAWRVSASLESWRAYQDGTGAIQLVEAGVTSEDVDLFDIKLQLEAVLRHSGGGYTLEISAWEDRKGIAWVVNTGTIPMTAQPTAGRPAGQQIIGGVTVDLPAIEPVTGYTWSNTYSLGLGNARKLIDAMKAGAPLRIVGALQQTTGSPWAFDKKSSSYTHYRYDNPEKLKITLPTETRKSVGGHVLGPNEDTESGTVDTKELKGFATVMPMAVTVPDTIYVEFHLDDSSEYILKVISREDYDALGGNYEKNVVYAVTEG